MLAVAPVPVPPQITVPLHAEQRDVGGRLTAGPGRGEDVDEVLGVNPFQAWHDAQGGRWHKPWDPQLQAEWMDAVYKLAFSKPYVESVAWGDLADLSHKLPGGGLLDDMLKPKPSYTKLQELREKFHQWHVKKG